MPFEKGNNANPLGAGAQKHRLDLQKRVDARLLADFEKYGEVVIQKLRTDNPAKYIDLVLSRLPKDPTVVNATVEQRSLVEVLTGLGESTDIALAAGRSGSVREGSVRLDS